METKHPKIFPNQFQGFKANDLIPKDKLSQQILKDRAKQFAKNNIDQVSKVDTISYIHCGLQNNESYGIPYKYTLEVIDNSIITELPYTNPSIAGVMNRRGALLTIVNLNQFLNGKNEMSEHFYIIVVESQGVKLGLLVDRVHGSEEYAAENFNQSITYEGLVNSKYILGLDKGSTAILNIENIILDLQQLLENH